MITVKLPDCFSLKPGFNLLNPGLIFLQNSIIDINDRDDIVILPYVKRAYFAFAQQYSRLKTDPTLRQINSFHSATFTDFPQ